MRYPALAVYGAWIRALTGRPAEAERWLALADGATSTIALSDGSATIEPWIATLRAHMMRDGVEQALADAELALDRLPAGSPWIPTARLARGVAHTLLEATELATEDLTATVEKGVALGSVEEIYLAHALLALLDAKAGAWGRPAYARGRHRPSSTRRVSASSRRARSPMSPRRASRIMRAGRRMPARR